LTSPSRPEEGRTRVVIGGVTPEIDGGRCPAKRVAGDQLVVEADIYADGHDRIGARLLWKKEGETAWREAPLRPLVNDRWRGVFPVATLGHYRFTLTAWIDHFETWREALQKRIEAGQKLAVELRIGAALVREAAAGAQGEAARGLRGFADRLEGEGPEPRRAETALDPALHELMQAHPVRRFEVTYGREPLVAVDPPRARFNAWYELFPRSCGKGGKHGTFRDVEARLPYVAELGFDVLYLPPVHPIGRSYRKGPNNVETCKPGDPGSPWAIGSAEGGHTAIHPELGTLQDFRHLVAAAKERGIDVALDIAFQATPDHPWVKEHPEWFRARPDGSIQYAENPPKKYQDIYPLDFESGRWRELWDELKAVFDFWIAQGVRIFRVDNPHTKPFVFWEWCLNAIKAEHPDVLFLAEAFTRPKVMYRLAQAGFSLSYTYFPWRNTRWGLTEYLSELTQPPVADFFRASQWTNTPDILTAFLQYGGRPAFMIRLVLAATLGASYGIYGPAFELCEARALREGSEEYLDSEKYQIRDWALDRPDSLRGLIARVNRIRRDNPALQDDRGLRFHPADNEQILCYSKTSTDGDSVVLVVVNLDPHHTQSGWIQVPLDRLGADAGRPFQVHDLLSDARYMWSGDRHYVELNPFVAPAHVFRAGRLARSEKDFEYYL
jgi:starch synthase (maltosyl-transferring)